MNHTLAAYEAPEAGLGSQMNRLAEHLGKLRRHLPHGDSLVHVIAVVDRKNAEAGSAEKRRLLQYRIEHRGQIARRAVDDPENFSRRSLPLQRLLGFVEQ